MRAKVSRHAQPHTRSSQGGSSQGGSHPSISQFKPIHISKHRREHTPTGQNAQRTQTKLPRTAMTPYKYLISVACLISVSILASASASLVPDSSTEMKSIFDDVDSDAEIEADGADQQRRLRSRYSKRTFTVNVDLNVTNLSFQQPFSPFFVMVHNRMVDPLFTLGMPSSDGLKDLAENGSPAMLVEMYKNNPNVLFVEAMGDGPLAAGGKTTLTVPVTFSHQYVTIATMAVNTNDW